MRRSLVQVAGTALVVVAAGSTAPLGAPAHAADAVSLAVPASPGGDVVTSVTADPATAPYVQVRLIGADVPDAVPPAVLAGAISPVPIANDGSSLAYVVPSWGLDATAATFVLLGCSTVDPATCTDQLATARRQVTQTQAATATFDAPAEPVFVPEERVVATGHDGGGGRLVLTRGAVPRHPAAAQDLTSGVPTPVADWPDTAGTTTLSVARCSTLTTASGYCEPAVASRSVTFVRSLPLTVVMGSVLPTLTVDPSWHGSHQPTSIYGPLVPYRLRWELLDGTGTPVAGPVDLDNEAYGLGQVDVSPGAAATGPLPDGQYTVRFTATVTKDDLSRTNVVDHPVRLVNDPPADHPATTVSARVFRPGRRHQPVPSFEVQAYPGPGSGRVALVLTRGERQLRLPVDYQCRGPWPACPDAVWRASLDEAATNALHVGRWRVVMRVPDSWGRMVPVALGRVRVE